jgi:prophage maintenance system killer protein
MSRPVRSTALLFLDGNKRVALASSLAFIWLNNQRLEAGEDEPRARLRQTTSGNLSGGLYS